jgi:NAD(P)-dependent dehydrogenase (short-subunit alcohol dehydrogenase family)
MKNKLAGQVILVTGCNRGIGKSIVAQLAEKDATIYALCRKKSEGESALKNINGNVTVVAADVTNQEEVDVAFKLINNKEKHIDALINNAGVNLNQNDADAFHKTMDVNLFGCIRMADIFMPLLLKSKAGTIVNVSSTLGSVGDDVGHLSTSYGISKAALNTYTRTLSRDLSNTKIKVHSIHPGWVRTDMGGMSAPLTTDEGADTAVWLVGNYDSVDSGKFWNNRRQISW